MFEKLMCFCPQGCQCKRQTMLFPSPAGFFVTANLKCDLGVRVSAGSLDIVFPLEVEVNGQQFERGPMIFESKEPGERYGHAQVAFRHKDAHGRLILWVSNEDDFSMSKEAVPSFSILVRVVSYTRKY